MRIEEGNQRNDCLLRMKDYQAITEIFADFLGNAVAKSKTLLNNLASRDKNIILHQTVNYF